MAYAATVKYYTANVGGRRELRVRVDETEAAAGSVYQITVPFDGCCRIMRIDSVKSSGSATTLQPAFSGVTSPAATQLEYVGQVATAAAQIHDTTPLAVNLSALSGDDNVLGPAHTLHGCSTVNTGSDNTIATVIVFREGLSG